MAKGQKKQAQEKIDQTQFESLCGIQCTHEEICAVFGVSIQTLERWCHNTYGMSFGKVFKTKREAGKVSLRHKQWQKAVKSNDTTMLIFLGKQYLGQTDKTTQSVVAVSNEARDELSKIMTEIDDEFKGEVCSTAEEVPV